MPAQPLTLRRVAKPWGRRTLWPGFADPAPGEDAVGEVWFQGDEGDEADLLIKYLFTSEKLSIQVHPDDAQAHARGLPRGKDECWLILAAEPDSTIAIGTHERVDDATLRAAALDGSIERLVDWKPVKAGDFIYSPSGTIHAIGAGLTLIEVQQNSETTYRLYDYGRPRELHLDDGVAVSDAEPFTPPAPPPAADEPGRTMLVEGPKFVLERWTQGVRHIALPAGRGAWLTVVSGDGSVDGVAFAAGQCLLLRGACTIDAAAGADLLLAYPGTQRLELAAP